MEEVLAICLSIWLVYRLFKPKQRTKPMETAIAAPQRQVTHTTIAQYELLESLLSRIDGLQDEYNRLDRECEIAIATGNTKKLDTNAKKIDRLTEQIARKKLQAAQLQDKLTRTF